MIKHQRIYLMSLVLSSSCFLAGLVFGLAFPEHTPSFLLAEKVEMMNSFRHQLTLFRPEDQRLGIAESLSSALASSSWIFRHIVIGNLYAGFLSVALGIVFGLAPLIQATVEGIRVSWDFQFPSLLPFNFAFHGVLEIFAALLFQSTGLFIFFAVFQRLRRRIRLREAFLDVGKLVTLASILMIVAAFLETIPSHALITMFLF